MKWDESHLLARLYQNLPDGVIITDAESRILSVNRSFTEITGFTLEEVLHKNPDFLKSGKQSSEFYDKMWEAVLSKGNWQGELWNQKKNGELYLQRMTLCSVIDSSDRIVNYFAAIKDVTQREKMRRDLTMAGKIQRRMLPSDLTNGGFSLRTIYQPAQYVSGDMYDYIWNEENETLFGFLIDVMGHGLAVSLQVSALRVLFRQAYRLNGSVAEKMNWINNESLKYFIEDTFAAAFCFLLDMKNGTLTYAAGGITSFYMCSGNNWAKVKTAGVFLGMMPEMKYSEQSLTVKRGDFYCFLTDGLLDLIDNEIFRNDLSCDEVYEKLRQLAYRRENRDDASGLCLKINK